MSVAFLSSLSRFSGCLSGFASGVTTGVTAGVTALASKVFSVYESLWKHLYLHGPTWLGCWEGLSLEDICQQLTAVRARFWAGQPDECNSLLSNKMQAFMIAVHVIGLTVLTSWLCYSFMHYCLYWKPLIAKLDVLSSRLPILKPSV
jgi:hypothetical protein